MRLLDRAIRLNWSQRISTCKVPSALGTLALLHSFEISSRQRRVNLGGGWWFDISVNQIKASGSHPVTTNPYFCSNKMADRVPGGGNIACSFTIVRDKDINRPYMWKEKKKVVR